MFATATVAFVSLAALTHAQELIDEDLEAGAAVANCTKQIAGKVTYNCTDLFISACSVSGGNNTNLTVRFYSGQLQNGTSRCPGQSIGSCNCGTGCQGLNLYTRSQGPFWVADPEGNATVSVSATTNDGLDTCQAIEDILKWIIIGIVGFVVVFCCVPVLLCVLLSTVCGVAICGVGAAASKKVVAVENVYQPV
jgi:hypothetical protein